MGGQAGGDSRCGIGARLRAGRERRGLTVLQAAERLHVDPKTLESLEAEDFTALDAPVYVRGHLRRYAELVGEPAAELQELYASTTRTAQPDLTRIPKVEPASDPRKLVLPALALVTGFAIAGGVWWVLTLSKGGSGAARTAQTAPTAQTASSGTAASSLAPAAEAATRGEPRAVAMKGSGPASLPAVAPQTNGVSRPATITAAAGADAPPGAATKPRQAQLTLRFSAESWAEVYDSEGQRLFYDIGAPDSTRSFKGTPPLRIVLGNAPGVAVEVNGRLTDIGALTHADGTAQFVVNRSGRAAGASP
jgi:cytoskeleton protein RodZ